MNRILNEARIINTKIIRTTSFQRPFPTLFYYPGLSSKPWHDKNLFKFTRIFEENHEIIHKEYSNLKEVYKVNDYDSTTDKEHRLKEGKMNWIKLIDRGKRIKEVESLCPKTLKLINNIPEIATDITFVNTFFNRLAPNSETERHTGPCNIKLRCCLSLSCPEESYLRVASIPQKWNKGTLYIFDESYEHEEINLDNKKETETLVFDIWHPDLALEEREALKTIFKKMEEKIEKDTKKVNK